MLDKYSLEIALHQVQDFETEFKFGAIDNLVSGTQTVWSAGGLYPWSAFATGAETLYIISTSTADTGTVTIKGLDSDYNFQEETVTATGTTAVATTKTFARIYRMQYTGAAVNAGTVTARVNSGTGTVVGHIKQGVGQTLVGIYTVPAGYNAYIVKFTAGIGKGGDAEFQFFAREPSGSFQIKDMLELYQATFTQAYAVPRFFGEKTDIDFRAITGGNNFSATVSFDIILDKK